MIDFHFPEDALNDAAFGPNCNNFKNLNFQSKSEAACAALMQKYINGWECVENITFQVPLAQNRRADFRIGPEIVFEYHPISLHREMISDNARHSLERQLKQCKQYLKDEILDAVKDELYYQYFARRQILVRATPGLENAELIVAIDSRGFYRKVIQRFSDAPPGLREFSREWDNLMRQSRG